MKKILVLFVTFSILLTTVTTVMAPFLPDYQLGAAFISCYCYPEFYNYPNFSIPYYEDGITYNIPQSICPPLKRIQIGLSNFGFETGNFVNDTGGHNYLCTANSECENWPMYLNVCGDHKFRVYFFDSGGQMGDPSEGSCFTVQIPAGAIRFRIGNEIVSAPLNGTVNIYKDCCYDCRKVQEPPAKILYPKVDIETFSVSGGPTVIKDGKVISNFNIVPGIQTVMIQLENRGFFTQKDSMIRFEGIPDGITVNVSPPTQAIKAQNIGTYEATFTVGPNVPSSTYTITMIAYSPKGVLDKIEFKIVVP